MINKIKNFFELKVILCILSFILSIVAVTFVIHNQAVTSAVGGSEFEISNNIFFFGDSALKINGTVMPLIGYIFIPIAGAVGLTNIFIRKDRINIIISFASFLLFLMCSILIFQSKYRFITINHLTPTEYVSEATHLTSYPVAAAVLSIAAGILSISFIFVNDRKSKKN